MAGGTLRIESSNSSVSVSLTETASGNSTQLYADPDCTVTLTQPVAVPANTPALLYVVNGGAYTLSVKSNGTEIAGGLGVTRQVVFDHGEFLGLRFNPSREGLLDLSGTYASTAVGRINRVSTLRGIPCVVGQNVVLGAAAAATVGTGRAPFFTTFAVTDLRLTYANWRVSSASGSGQDLDGTADLVLKASVEYSGTIYPVTFGGLLSVTVNPGGMVQSDPLPIEIASGATVYVRTYTTGSAWYAPRVAYVAATEGGFTATTDLTPAGSAAIPDSTTFTYIPAPVVITGTPLTATVPPTVLGVGDSTAQGSGDGVTSWNVTKHATNIALGGGGWIARACTTAGAGFVNAALNGDTTTNLISNVAHWRRFAVATTCSTAVVLSGRNDLSNGRTATQLQADLITLWSMLSGRGLRVIGATITPRSTSTNGWTDLAGQTTAGGNSFRLTVNDWIRDGAPILAGSAVATGSGASGTLRAGMTGHPLYSYIEIADTVESSRNSGLWKASTTLRTVTDAAATNGSGLVTSASGNFTAADIGKQIVIMGAGAAGVPYVGMILSVTNSTTIVVPGYGAPGTTVTGATAYIVDGFTLDGTHTPPAGHALMAAAVDTSKFI